MWLLSHSLPTNGYVRVAPLAEPAKDAVKNGDIQFVPKQYENMYFSWMNDVQDWCISRQLWWGHRIPAWYDSEGNVYVGRDEAEVRRDNNIAAASIGTPGPMFPTCDRLCEAPIINPTACENIYGAITTAPPVSGHPWA